MLVLYPYETEYSVKLKHELVIFFLILHQVFNQPLLLLTAALFFKEQFGVPKTR